MPFEATSQEHIDQEGLSLSGSYPAQRQDLSACDGGRRCPLCGTVRSSVQAMLPEFLIRRCQECGLLSRTPTATEAELLAVYDSPEYWEEPYFRNALSNYCPNLIIQTHEAALSKLRQLAPDARTLLDVGSGTGRFMHLARCAGWKVEGIELSEIGVRMAWENFGLVVRHGSIESLSLASESFDVITLWDVLEHLIHPVEVVRKVVRALNRGGVLLIFTPNSRSLIRTTASILDHCPGHAGGGLNRIIYSPLHLHYFNPENLSALLGSLSARVVVSWQLPMNPAQAHHIGGITQLGLRALDLVGGVFGRCYRFLVIARSEV